MHLSLIDWVLVGLLPLVSLLIGLIVSRRAGENSASYFLSGRRMPWWLLGISMVATTFATDTPNLVTDIVRNHGVAGNWTWWAFLLTGIVTAFIYAKLWRRSGIMTDLEFYEIRYSSEIAKYLRGFRALYLGVFFNVIVMATVTLAAIKIASVLVGATPLETILVLGVVTMAFSALGGFVGVVISDLVLFVAAMVGAAAAAWFALDHPSVGGLEGLINNPVLAGKISFFPDFSNIETAVTIFIVPLVIQWWSVWYPGSEPGGGGYVAQRMLAAKDANHAMGAVILFQVAHYALRPWPWILVALASLIVFPDLDALREAFPHVDESKIGHDLAYPAMLSFLPSGVLGLVVASLAAAYMSTMSTQLNWGASYVVNDFYARFIRPDADEKELVLVGRLSTVIMMVLAGALALFLSGAMQSFYILLTIGAGTGLLFLLRWYWWRINAYSEIAAMIISFMAALGLQFFAPDGWSEVAKMVAGVAITTVGWMLVTFVTPATDQKTLFDFVKLVNPAGPGWRLVRAQAKSESVELPSPETGGMALTLACVPIACVGIYSLLFATGHFLYGRTSAGLFLLILASVCGFVIWRNRGKLADMV